MHLRTLDRDGRVVSVVNRFMGLSGFLLDFLL
jgi:hypothetical protein